MLLLVGRVVNIALPLSYKKVVDRLAETSAAAAAAAASQHGGDGCWKDLLGALAGAAGPTFKAVFFPWVALYLLFTFLQVGSM